MLDQMGKFHSMSNSINNRSLSYGVKDASYLAAGEEAGLRQLCTDFYHLMSTLPEAQKIRQMHKDDLEIMIDKLTLFLSMWLGGPKTYQEKYNFVGMPAAHQHLIINESEREAWLLCMDLALEKQPFEESFKFYLKKQFRFPAEMIYRTSRKG